MPNRSSFCAKSFELIIKCLITTCCYDLIMVTTTGRQSMCTSILRAQQSVLRTLSLYSIYNHLLRNLYVVAMTLPCLKTCLKGLPR
jgi:hypothetical protein